MQASNILILGAGFVGAHLHRTLANSHRAVELVSSAACDLTQADQVEDALRNCDSSTTVVMTAAVSRLRDNSYAGFSLNVLMAEKLSEGLRRKSVRNVVFLSSVDVYGLLEEGQTIHEGLPLRPDDYYAMSKVVSEFILTKSCRAQRTPLAILRLTGVYGPGDSARSTMWHLTQSAFVQGTISVYGDGRDERDFVLVEDVARVISCESVAPHNHVLNIATGTSLTIMEIAQIIARTVPCRIEQAAATRETTHPARAKVMRFDIAKLKGDFPEFEACPPTALPEGIRRYLDDWTRVPDDRSLPPGTGDGVG